MSTYILQPDEDSDVDPIEIDVVLESEAILRAKEIKDEYECEYVDIFKKTFIKEV